MGKCSKCGKKIEYNNYKVISGLVYCPDCTPEEAIDPEVMKAEKEAQEQFEKDMADCKEIDIESLKAEEEATEQFLKNRDECKEIEDKIANDPDIEIVLDEKKKPRKKRNQK